MESLHIPATATTPEVRLDRASGQLLIQGTSDEMDALGFYFPVIQWMESYVHHSPAESTVLEIKLLHFNTASAKALFDVIKHLKQLQKAKKDVEVNWYYDADDPVLKEDIEQFCDLTSVPINAVAGA